MNDLYIQGVHIDWNKIPVNSYLREIDAIKGLEELIFHNSITFFVGENGSGKSTLLEALAVACGFNPEGGTKNYIFSTYDSHSQLHEAIRVVKGYRQAKWGYFLRAESFYNVATKEEEYADWEHPSEKYHEKSHGESFLALAQNYLKPNGVYFFDEPEAALSPQRQLTLLMEIHACARQVFYVDRKRKSVGTASGGGVHFQHCIAESHSNRIYSIFIQGAVGTRHDPVSSSGSGAERKGTLCL